MMGENLEEVVDAFRNHAGLRAKAGVGLVTEILGPTDWVHGPGDDAAVVPLDGRLLLAGGEALWPPFVEADPVGAGIGAVIANVNDIAAMGGRCLGIVDTIVAPEPVARAILSGLRQAANLYGVPILGGHLTLREGPPSLSAFAIGTATRPLSASRVDVGQVLLSACCLDGEVRADFPFFRSYDRRGSRVRGDVELLALLAERGDCVAARDVSMAGLLGSLAMLLEPTGCGAVVDLGAIPRPPDVPLPVWNGLFPSYGFLLTAEPARADACRAAFVDRGLACAQIGHIDDSGTLSAHLDGRQALLLDLADGVTSLAGAPRPPTRS
jgi:uncharacterized protein